MKKLNIKSLMIGLVLGSIFFGTASYAASTIKTASYNTDVKYNVLGQDFTTESVFVVNSGDTNGKNYVSVRVLAEKLGYAVNYDSKLKTVFITSPDQTKHTPDGITVLEYYNGKYYVPIYQFRLKYANKGYWINLKPVDGKTIYYLTLNNEVILNNMQISNPNTLSPDSYSYIEYDYYVNTVLPLLK